MQNGFETVRNDFSNFTLKFEDWGEERMKQAGEEIKQLNADLNDLRIKLGKMQAALVAVGAIAVGTLPATGIIAALSGPLAPFVMVCTCSPMDRRKSKTDLTIFLDWRSSDRRYRCSYHYWFSFRHCQSVPFSTHSFPHEI